MIGGILSRFLGQRPATEIPDALWQEAVADLHFLSWLDDEDLRQLRALAARFLDEKEFSATGGLVLDDRMRLSIAIQGCLPVLRLGLEWYSDWVGIVVYPAEFVIPRSVVDEDGVVHEYDEVAAGEAWGGGPLLVSWQDVAMAGQGYNVVIHEFAHKLDMRNGEADGLPPLPPGMSRRAWEETLLAAYDDFCERVDAAEAGGDETTIDPYAAKSPGEFFAVLSEVFFEEPQLLQAEYPALYAQFAAFYRLDPLLHAQAGKSP